MRKYLINGQVVDESNVIFDEHLVSAYQQKSRPLCLCRDPGLQMYITKTGEHHIIKRMPNSGQEHHPDCDSFEIPSELSGRGAVENKAIDENSQTGLTSLKLDFSLSKILTNKNIALQNTENEKKSIKANPTKLTIRSLLHYLYEDAGLNRWFPLMKNKRNWFVIRKHLLEAIKNKITKKNNLSETLLIPESFSVEKKDTIFQNRKKYFSGLKKKGHKQPMGIIIGEVKNIESARFGYKLLIKHMPESPIYMDEAIYKRINKNFATELAFFKEYETVHLLSICTFYLSASGNPQIDSISFMLTDINWIPFETIDEFELIEHLITGKRRFIKGLRYNLSSTDIIASVLITDIQDNPTAVYIVPCKADESYYDKITSVTSESNFSNYIWNLNDNVPLRLPK